jgi:hypothetical protein
MEKRPISAKVFASGGLLLMLPAVITLVLWINAFNANLNRTQEEKVAAYLNNFPGFLLSGSADQSILNLTLIVIVTSIVSIIAGTMSINRNRYISGSWQKLLFKGIGLLTIVISLLFILLNLFQFM